MEKTARQDSLSTRNGGVHGMTFGALLGGLLMYVASFVIDHMFQFGTGGPGLQVMAGIVVGGGIGFFTGLLRSRHQPAPIQ